MELVAKELSKHFDDAGRRIEVLHGISLNVPSGSSLSVIGESGVGKTTLLHLLGALEIPDGGEVRLGGISYADYYKVGRDIAAFRGERIGFIFQFHHLLPEFDAKENVAMPLLIRGMGEAEANSRAEELLVRVGLKERLTHRPGMLSGGEQQRVAIARAVAGKPGVILADEPTGNLDVKTGSIVIELLLSLQREENITLILVTHSLELAGMTSRVVELTQGGIVERPDLLRRSNG